MPLNEKTEKKSAKRVPSDQQFFTLFGSKHVFWNCEKEESCKGKKTSSPVLKHATRTSSDQPKSLIQDNMKGQEVKSDAVKNIPSDGSISSSPTELLASKESPQAVMQDVPKQQQPDNSKTAIASVAKENSIKIMPSQSSSLVKVVPSRFSSTQLLKNRKGSSNSLSSSREPKTTISFCLKPSSPEGSSKKEVLPQSVVDVVKAFLSKQSTQYTVKE